MTLDRPLVLIVDDSRSNVMLAREVLDMSGYQCAAAHSVSEAKGFLAEQHPALILMDIQMPDQDGISFTRELKADPRTASIPVVALSGRVMEEDRRQALDAGFADYLTKPLDIGTFRERLKGLIDSPTSSPSGS